MIVGAALGGGGAKGLAHIGVLKALAEERINFEVLSGTSAGALVGSAYCAGRLEQLEKEVRNLTLRQLPRLLTPTLAAAGFFSAENFLTFMRTVLGTELIETLPVKFAAVSVDLLSGRTISRTQGDLIKAVRASMSIPGVFTPVELDGMLLVDGGITDPVPVEAVRALGAEFVLAVDLFANTAVTEQQANIDAEKLRQLSQRPAQLLQALLRFSAKEEQSSEQNRTNLLTVLERSLKISQRQLTALQFARHQPDFIIAPPVEDVGFFDFYRGETGIERGYQAAKKVLPQLKELLRSRRDANRQI